MKLAISKKSGVEDFKIYLRDLNPGMVLAWQKYFKELNDCEDVHISCGDIFADGTHMTADAIVSPANSFGFMESGIDYAYSDELGWGMSRALQKNIFKFHNGELLVGEADIVNIRHTNDSEDSNPQAKFNYLISAPTMRVPMNVANTVNAYLAFRATLRCAEDSGMRSILCPGLGTAIGGMPFEVCALQMFEAYKFHNRHKSFTVLGAAHMRHHMMMTPGAYDMTLQAGQ